MMIKTLIHAATTFSFLAFSSPLLASVITVNGTHEGRIHYNAGVLASVFDTPPRPPELFRANLGPGQSDIVQQESVHWLRQLDTPRRGLMPAPLSSRKESDRVTNMQYVSGRISAIGEAAGVKVKAKSGEGKESSLVPTNSAAQSGLAGGRR